MLLKLLAGSLLGFLSSRLLYDKLHQEEVPETFRYGAGIVVVSLVMALLIDDPEKRKEAITNLLMASVGVGIGVEMNRIFMQ